MTIDEGMPTKGLRNSEGTSAYPLVVRASSLVIPHFFDFVPHRVHLRKIHVAKSLALSLQLVLQSIESRHKFVRTPLQRAFRVKSAFPGQINDCKKNVADLFFGSRWIGRRHCLFQLAKLFFQFCHYIAHVRRSEEHTSELQSHHDL